MNLQFAGVSLDMFYQSVSQIQECATPPAHAHRFHLGMKISQDLPSREHINLWIRRAQDTRR